MDLGERVARAIGKLDGIPEELWSASVPHARAAIAAMREPTEGMVHKAEVYALRYTDEDHEGVYRAMIDAAFGELGTK